MRYVDAVRLGGEKLVYHFDRPGYEVKLHVTVPNYVSLAIRYVTIANSKKGQSVCAGIGSKPGQACDRCGVPTTAQPTMTLTHETLS